MVGLRRIEVPEFPKLRGQEAKQTLQELIQEFEEQRGKELTDKQTNTLVEFAKGLISSIEMEMGANPSTKDLKEGHPATRAKRTIAKHVQESISQPLHFA